MQTLQGMSPQSSLLVFPGLCRCMPCPEQVCFTLSNVFRCPARRLRATRCACQVVSNVGPSNAWSQLCPCFSGAPPPCAWVAAGVPRAWGCCLRVCGLVQLGVHPQTCQRVLTSPPPTPPTLFLTSSAALRFSSQAPDLPVACASRTPLWLAQQWFR